jgi:hypothetical protein
MPIPRPRYNSKKKRRNKSKFKRGIYYPKNPEKFQQPIDETMNQTKGGVQYRSSWELAFAKYLDLSPSVIKWSAEPFAIKYISPKDNKSHRYYIDFVFSTSEDTFLVEIKPKNQCNLDINKAKWEAARYYAKSKGYKFLVITEIELKKWGII